MVSKLQAHLMVDEGDIAPYVLLPGDPNRVLRIGEKMDYFREVAYNREFRTITGSYEGIPVTVTSSGIGGPSAAIAVEELANSGAKVVIRTPLPAPAGCAGCIVTGFHPLLPAGVASNTPVRSPDGDAEPAD